MSEAGDRPASEGLIESAQRPAEAAAQPGDRVTLESLEPFPVAPPEVLHPAQGNRFHADLPAPARPSTPPRHGGLRIAAGLRVSPQPLYIRSGRFRPCSFLMETAVPSLKSLAAFEATARLGSMTAAAAELGSTQPAVSQRIRALEEELGLPLFDRSSRHLRPTRDGEAFYEEIAGPLQRIAGASRRLQSRARARHRELVIVAHFGFAHRWLLPRLPRLESAFPGTRFEVFPADRDDLPGAARADLAIRFGRLLSPPAGEWPLFHETVFPVCSPAAAARHGLGTAVDADTLARVPLLHMDEHDPRWLNWHQWCELAGFQPPPRSSRFNYNNYPLVLNAAAEGKGLALGWAGLVESMIEEGTLFRLGPAVDRPDRGYLLSARHPDSATVAPVVDWFLRNTAAS